MGGLSDHLVRMVLAHIIGVLTAQEPGIAQPAGVERSKAARTCVAAIRDPEVWPGHLEAVAPGDVHRNVIIRRATGLGFWRYVGAGFDGREWWTFEPL